MSNDQKLVELYEDLAFHTAPECEKSCRAPRSCCSSEYCDMAKHWAEERWGVHLSPTGHPTLPFMGSTGCIVPPHMRPLCTRHTCAVNSLGFKPNDTKWTRKYFQIVAKIDLLEIEDGI